MNCLRCGATSPGDYPDAIACDRCPPVGCADCGESDDRSCRCWVSVENLNLADCKAIFAADGTFNIGINGEGDPSMTQELDQMWLDWAAEVPDQRYGSAMRFAFIEGVKRGQECSDADRG